MARTPFRVEILTPEGEVFNDEVEMVSTRTAVGSIGILAHHQPMLADLDPAELRLHRSENEVISLAQGDGFLQVSPSQVLLLVDEIQEPGALDGDDLRDRVRAADDQLTRCAEGTEEQRVAKRDKRRYETWLKMLDADRR